MCVRVRLARFFLSRWSPRTSHLTCVCAAYLMFPRWLSRASPFTCVVSSCSLYAAYTMSSACVRLARCHQEHHTSQCRCVHIMHSSAGDIGNVGAMLMQVLNVNAGEHSIQVPSNVCVGDRVWIALHLSSKTCVLPPASYSPIHM